jgi:hypothetical protein
MWERGSAERVEEVGRDGAGKAEHFAFRGWREL